MRTTQRDRRIVWYSMYQGLTDVTDSDGNLTGEQEITYSTPTAAYMNVSGGRGKSTIEAFGVDNPFTRTLVTDDLKTPFDTTTVFWIYSNPKDANGNNVPYNHICTGVSRTINGVTIAVKEIDVTHENGNTPIISG